jgi:hypothetical protein
VERFAALQGDTPRAGASLVQGIGSLMGAASEVVMIIAFSGPLR